MWCQHVLVTRRCGRSSTRGPSLGGGGDAALPVEAMTKETVEVFAVAVRVVVFLEWGGKEERGGDGLFVLFCAT